MSPRSESIDSHAIDSLQPNDSQRSRELLGEVQLGGRAKVHAAATVDQGVKVQILLVEEQLEEQAVESRVEIPVEEPKVVAVDILAKVGELDAMTLALRSPFALQMPRQHLARGELQLFKPSQELVG